MSNPLVPNYVKGVGRLVTDRYDFQDHIDGYSFRHNATQIDLSPAITFDGYTETTVQDALQILSTYVVAPNVPDATTTNKGIIQLSGDLSGTATNITVNSIQNVPIQPIIPSAVGQVLTWDGIGWYPDNPSNVFNAGGDLGGNNFTQTVEGITGDGSSIVTIDANTFNFTESTTPVFSQDDNTTATGSDFKITAQNSTVFGGSGGNVTVSGGSSGGGAGLNGGVLLYTNDNNSPLVQLVELSGNRRVVSLAHDSIVDIIDMPANTGDRVIYIADAAAAPSLGANPSGGSILYSSGGKLYVKQSDGDNFALGSIPNPSIWGGGNRYVYSYRATSSTTNATPATALSFVMPNFTIVKADVLVVGKRTNPGSNDAYQTNMSRGFTINNTGGVVTALSATNYFDTQSAGLLGITPPNITNVGTTLSITTGALAAVNINWLVVVQLTVCG